MAPTSRAWITHAPFAFWLVENLKPNSFVELGTYYGFSYFCFCQQVALLKLPTSCVAVDTWTGDEHAGFTTNLYLMRLKKLMLPIILVSPAFFERHLTKLLAISTMAPLIFFISMVGIDTKM